MLKRAKPADNKKSKITVASAAGFLRKAICFTALILLIITQTGCSSDSAEPVTGENFLLDTVCTVSIYEMTGGDGTPVPAAELKEKADQVIKEAFDLCAALDKTLSRTQEVSDVSRINNAKGEWTEVSDDTLKLIKAGIRYAELSGGDFDITIGGVTSQWDFHADPENAKLPDADALAEAVKHVGYEKIEIEGNRVRLTDPDTEIDLGGIAKGYIGDRMTDCLQNAGVTSAIINLGGNVICIGGKDNKSEGDEGAFVIGVEAPFSDRTEIVGTINARDMTLVTSGVYERKIEVDGKLYHHILDTETGWSAETDLDAVTLTADVGHSMDVDALSTICLIKGCEEAKKLIENTDGIEAVFILGDGSTDQTSGMKFEADK